MAVNIAGLTSGLTAISNLIAVTPNSNNGYIPQSLLGPTGQPLKQPTPILFHYEGEQTVVLESDITDHFVEDNTAINDQIALRPEVITTHGFIGELNDVPPNQILALLQVAAQKLTAIGAYAPGLSATALLAYNEATFLYDTGANAVNSAVGAITSIVGSPSLEAEEKALGLVAVKGPVTVQAQYFMTFYGYWKQKTLFTVQTPYGIFQDMAIKTLRAVQDADTDQITDFQVTFKIVRFAQTATTQGSYQNRLVQQAAPGVNQGIVPTGASVPQVLTQ